jgi:hypothetical protein
MDLLTLLGLLLCLLALATWVGLRLPKTHVAASRVRLNAPLDAVWDAVVDFAEYPAWRPGLARVEAGPEIGGKPSWYEYCGARWKVQLQFAEFEPKTRLVSRLVGEPLSIFGTWIYEFAEDGGGTVLTITESDKIYHPLLRFFSRFLFPHHAAMDVFLIALARYFGSESQPEHLSVKKNLSDI